MKLEAETKRGWHFTDYTLRNGSPIPGTGEWLRHDGEIIPCTSGLHMSEHPWDALAYVPGPILHRVELRGDLASHGDPVDKWVGRERRIIVSRDATDMMRRFAKDQALGVADKWEMPDVFRKYLVSDSEDLRSAARDAARNAVWYATQDAARDAVRFAAWDSARFAARSAARDAAWDAARNAARFAVRFAARDAGRDAELDAALNAAKSDFANRVHELFKEHAE